MWQVPSSSEPKVGGGELEGEGLRCSSKFSAPKIIRCKREGRNLRASR